MQVPAALYNALLTSLNQNKISVLKWVMSSPEEKWVDVSIFAEELAEEAHL